MKYVLKKIRRIRIESIKKADKGKHLATVDDLKNISIKGSNDTEYAEGRDGARLAAFDIKKVSTIEATNGSIDLDFMALQLGGEANNTLKTGTTTINDKGIVYQETHVITAEDESKGFFQLKYLPSRNVADDILKVEILDEDNNISQEYTNTSSKPSISGKNFKYRSNKSTSTETGLVTPAHSLGFATGDDSNFKAGNVVNTFYYPDLTKYSELTNDATAFGVTGKIYIDAWFTDLCTEEDVPLMLIADKGKVSGEYDYSFGDSVAVQNLKIECMSSNKIGGEKALWKLYTYNMEDADETDAGEATPSSDEPEAEPEVGDNTNEPA